MRRLGAILASLVVAVSLVSVAVRADGPLYPDLLALEDDYLDLSLTDLERTTAIVDTSSPGVVMLPRRPGALAYRPGKTEAVVCAEDLAKWYVFDGAGMVHLSNRDISFPGVRSGAFSADGGLLLLASDSQVRAYALDHAGRPYLVASVNGLSGLIAVDRGERRDFWALFSDRAEYRRWNGGSYALDSAMTITGFSAAKTLSYSDGMLLVLDGDTVRPFRVATGRPFELVAFRMTVPGASLVVQVQGGFRVLVGNASLFYTTAPGTPTRVPSLDDACGEAVAFAASPWSAWDYGALKSDGASYRTYRSGGMGESVAHSVREPFGVGYRTEAAFESVAVGASSPVSRVRLEASAIVPAACSVSYEVSVDAGATWIPVSLDENLDVPQGASLAYRITLATADPAATPKVDWVKALQIGYVLSGGSGSSAGRVRLVE